ncbi:MAG: hypothetical protein U0794_03980 [Isosphaeraceae bacterium]
MNRWIRTATAILVTLGPNLSQRANFASPPLREVEVECEEEVATCKPPDNGAGPLWCYGAPLLVRDGDRVFASVMETGEGVPPLSNTRWRLYQRDASGWRQVRQEESYREREPCPIVRPSPGRLVLSENPSTEPPGTQYGRCSPRLLSFETASDTARPTIITPQWSGSPRFTDHSYRGLAADPTRHELLALNIDAVSSLQHWALLGESGTTLRQGTIEFPIRACYPQVAMRDRAAHVLAVGDIVEPIETWRAYKKERTGAAWDYVFRRLFYTWTPDGTREPFHAPIEVATVDATAGHITNLDLWIGADGAARLLYLETSSTPLIRDRFFPGTPITTRLQYAEIARGQIRRRVTLIAGGEGQPEHPHHGRFHATPDGILHVVAVVSGADRAGRNLLENRLISLSATGEPVSTVSIPLKEPFTLPFTACERGGSAPSDWLDLFGQTQRGAALRYARVRLR